MGTLSDLLSLAHERAENLGLPYQGALTPAETWQVMQLAPRAKLVADMQGLGFEVLPSAANSIFARHPARDGAELTADLRKRAIIVRHFKAPRIDQFMRITIGTDAQCALLVGALRDILGQ